MNQIKNKKEIQMAKPISFGNYHFRTKKSATDEIRTRISKYSHKEKLDNDDELFFRSLFTLHGNYEDKKGAGIDHIEVEIDEFRNHCLYIHRDDDTKIDISWVTCLKQKTQKQIVSNAFGRAVKERIITFKETQLLLVPKCPYLEIELTKENSNVTYRNPTFNELIDSFLAERNLNYELVELTNPEATDGDQRGQLTDDTLKEEWKDFHKEKANLKLISAKANRKGMNRND